MSKRSRINSTLAPERYSATELLVRFSSTPKLSPLHFAVEWASEDPIFLGDPKQQNIQDPQSLNSYAYSNDNPVTKSDPAGKNPYLIVGSAAYVGSVTWDLGTDVYQNVNDSFVPWYGVLTPRGDDAALRYNQDAWSNVAVAESALSAKELAGPAAAQGLITAEGKKVIGATAGGVSNAIASMANESAYDQNTHKLSGPKLLSNFMSGFIGTRVGQSIPNPRGAPPVAFGTSVAGVRAQTEQIRVQLGQLVQQFFNYLSGLQAAQQQTSPSTKKP
jgi:hypothetical protein